MKSNSSNNQNITEKLRQRFTSAVRRNAKPEFTALQQMYRAGTDKFIFKPLDEKEKKEQFVLLIKQTFAKSVNENEQQ